MTGSRGITSASVASGTAEIFSSTREVAFVVAGVVVRDASPSNGTASYFSAPNATVFANGAATVPVRAGKVAWVTRPALAANETRCGTRGVGFPKQSLDDPLTLSPLDERLSKTRQANCE